MKVKVVETSEERQQAFNVRTNVFVNEQNVPPDIELDAFDEEAIHLIGFENDTPIAASRVRFVDAYGKLERICVLRDRRGNFYGKQLIQEMEDIIVNEGYTKAKLNAQTHALDFYRNLGYKIVSEEFMDAGIPHVTMVKELT
ncbi:GNAT family N-acetyltransferase [Virgibacillus doumboii]|uniref:GNAT family N-acetyltransferase n=1 Tax=Virgibacillus doumboii TaxID=2697503 RepID=UPI0013E0A990|nr:GNAT family N-acetyltransferase [Virgibacillus doumboii]